MEKTGQSANCGLSLGVNFLFSIDRMTANYTKPEELLADESFLSWYFHTEKDGGEDWNNWMKDSPERQGLVNEAAALLEAVHLREAGWADAGDSNRLQTAEVALFRKLAEMPSIDPPMATAAEAGPGYKPQRLYGARRWMVAAVLLLMLAGIVVITVRISGHSVMRTAYGQIVQQQLPDGTFVTLDANTRLTWPAGWKEGHDREVWISGEAFFHVRKTPTNSRFIVHTDHFDIIVTGTQFNVVNRHGDENILLEEGSVLLRGKDGREMALKPGDFVRFDQKSLARKTVKPDSVIAWRDQRLIFDKTSLRDLVTIVNDHYGVDIQLGNASLGDSTITAILPNNNLDVLLQALEATTEFDVIRNDDRITIVPHHDHN